MKSGDIIGGGFKQGQKPNVEQCADWCDSLSDCCAFEYSHSAKDCNLHMGCDPNNAPFGDYMFCKKSKLHYCFFGYSIFVFI